MHEGMKVPSFLLLLQLCFFICLLVTGLLNEYSVVPLEGRALYKHNNLYQFDVLHLASDPSVVWGISRSQEGNVID